MRHEIFSYGDPRKICWAIRTGDDIARQSRVHADIYLDRVTPEQSGYIALHVGLFWAIGVFIIKDGDDITIMTDSESAYGHLSGSENTTDKMAFDRKRFIDGLIRQRSLGVSYRLIDRKDNIAAP